MRVIKNTGFIFMLFNLLVLVSCTKDPVMPNEAYVFTKPYCATITVGGVVGLAEKCYEIGDIVTGKENTIGKLTIRIAKHSKLNEGPATSASYQEFLDVPLNYLEIIKQ